MTFHMLSILFQTTAVEPVIQLALTYLKYAGNIQITVFRIKFNTDHHIVTNVFYQFNAVWFFWVLSYVIGR